MARAKPVSSDELNGLATVADAMHSRLCDAQSRAEKLGLLDTGSLAQAEALMRLARAASDLALSIVHGAHAKQDRLDLEASLRAASEAKQERQRESAERDWSAVEADGPVPPRQYECY